LQWVNGFAILTNFKMQYRSVVIAGTQSGDVLPGCHTIAFFHEDLAQVAVSTQESIGMLDDDKSSVARKSTTAVNHLPR